MHSNNCALSQNLYIKTLKEFHEAQEKKNKTSDRQ